MKVSHWDEIVKGKIWKLSVSFRTVIKELVRSIVVKFQWMLVISVNTLCPKSDGSKTDAQS